MNQPKILFFTASRFVTPQDRIKAAEIGGNVKFRVAQLAAECDVEECDGVAGEVPANYKKAGIPSAEKAVEDYKNEILSKINQLKLKINLPPAVPDSLSEGVADEEENPDWEKQAQEQEHEHEQAQEQEQEPNKGKGKNK